MSTRLDPRAWRSRDALRRALTTLLERRTLNQIMVRDITDRAGVGYATFFRHYETKEALLDDLAADQIHQLAKMTLPALESSNSRTACIALCTHVNEHRRLWSALLTGGAAGTVKEEFMRVAQKIAASFPEPAGWLSKELGIACSVGAVVEVLAWWLRQPDALPIEQVAEALDHFAFEPLVR